MYPECALVQRDEIWIYYRGSNVLHRSVNELVGKTIEGQALRGDLLNLARFRLDGFVSIRAGKLSGQMTTWLLNFDGGELWVNADASQGSLQVELLGSFGKPISGFTREYCQALREDQVHQRIEWEGGRSLQDLGKPIRLRFLLESADLYSFQIRP